MLTKDDYYFQLASRIKMRMAVAGVTTRELGRRAHVTEVTLARILDGERQAKSYTVYKLMEALKSFEEEKQKREAMN